MNETFQLAKWQKYFGMASAAIWLAALVGASSLFFLDEPAKHGFNGKYSLLIVGGMNVAVFGSFMLLSVYLLVACYVERFTIKGTTFSIRSMFQNREFDISELQSVKWKADLPIVRISFHVTGSSSRLDLGGYAKSDQLKIVKAVRDLAPEEIQEGWPQFCHRVALRLLDDNPPIIRGEACSGFYTITRKRYDRLLIFILPASIAVAIALGTLLNLWQSIALPFMVIVGWLLLRSIVPPEGLTVVRAASSQRRSESIGTGICLITLLMLFGTMFGLVFYGDQLGEKKFVVMLIGFGITCVPMALSFPWIFLFQREIEKERRAKDERAARLAPAVWKQVKRIAASFNHGAKL